MKKVVIVTGGNRGLGKALIDVALKDENAMVFSLSRSVSTEHSEIPKTRLINLKTDLSQPFSNSDLDVIKQNVSAETEVYFFNNASIILPINSIGNFKNDEIEHSIKVNITYPTSLINWLLFSFPKNKLKLVNVTSGAGTNPISNWSLYGASKAYMKLFFKIIDEENQYNQNLLTYSIDPGVLDTGMQSDIRKNSFPKQEYFQSLLDENKLIQPEVAALKIFEEIGYK